MVSEQRRLRVRRGGPAKKNTNKQNSFKNVFTRKSTKYIMITWQIYTFTSIWFVLMLFYTLNSQKKEADSGGKLTKKLLFVSLNEAL